MAFVIKLASDQSKYQEQYPDLVGAATSTTTEEEETSSSADESIVESEALAGDESTETTAETTALGPVIQETTLPAETTEQVNSPDMLDEPENIYFYNTHSLQSISHEQRDILLDDLKQEIEDYIAAHPTERICFRYVNLASNEALGINDLEPICPAGSYALPIEIVYYEMVNEGILNPYNTVTYDGTIPDGGSSYIAATYTAGKQFLIRTCANYAVTYNDRLALSYLINFMGGMDEFNSRITEISGFIDFQSTVLYSDYLGIPYSGTGRTSAYDMAAYCEYLYQGYMNYPSVYQLLINDLYYSSMSTPYRNVFGDEAIILHSSGRNDTFHAYTDVAIIDGMEPFALCIYVECDSYERACVVQADLSTYVNRFISACHTEE